MAIRRAISNGAFLASTAPYRWLGRYGGYGGGFPLLGTVPYISPVSPWELSIAVRVDFHMVDGDAVLADMEALQVAWAVTAHMASVDRLAWHLVDIAALAAASVLPVWVWESAQAMDLAPMAALARSAWAHTVASVVSARSDMEDMADMADSAATADLAGHPSPDGPGYAGLGMGMGMGMGMAGMGGNSPEFGRLTNTRVIQTAPSKASGNYYAPSTTDPTASGSYYAGNASTSLVFPTSHKSGAQSYSKPQTNYSGSGETPSPRT